MRTYISGSLTVAKNVEQLKQFYERIGKVCEDLGIEAYIPHRHTDPIKHANLTPQDVYINDKRQVLKSDLLIAYVGQPSIGVGMEIAYADVHNIPIILMYKEGDIISRFPRGVPALKKIIKYKDENDAIEQLANFLQEFKQEFKEVKG